MVAFFEYRWRRIAACRWLPAEEVFPDIDLFLKRISGIGGAGGDKAAGADMVEQIIQGWADISFKGLFGFGAVEEYPVNAWIAVQQTVKVIGGDGIFLDIGVETAGPDTGTNNVPEANIVGQEDLQPPIICNIESPSVDSADDMPETVSGMGVILPFVKRYPARHAAENEGAGPVVYHRRKAEQCFHWLKTIRLADAGCSATGTPGIAYGESQAGDQHLPFHPAGVENESPNHSAHLSDPQSCDRFFFALFLSPRPGRVSFLLL